MSQGGSPGPAALRYRFRFDDGRTVVFPMRDPAKKTLRDLAEEFHARAMKKFVDIKEKHVGVLLASGSQTTSATADQFALDLTVNGEDTLDSYWSSDKTHDVTVIWETVEGDEKGPNTTHTAPTRSNSAPTNFVNACSTVPSTSNNSSCDATPQRPPPVAAAAVPLEALFSTPPQSDVGGANYDPALSSPPPSKKTNPRLVHQTDTQACTLQRQLDERLAEEATAEAPLHGAMVVGSLPLKHVPQPPKARSGNRGATRAHPLHPAVGAECSEAASLLESNDVVRTATPDSSAAHPTASVSVERSPSVQFFEECARALREMESLEGDDRVHVGSEERAEFECIVSTRQNESPIKPTRRPSPPSVAPDTRDAHSVSQPRRRSIESESSLSQQLPVDDAEYEDEEHLIGAWNTGRFAILTLERKSRRVLVEAFVAACRPPTAIDKKQSCNDATNPTPSMSLRDRALLYETEQRAADTLESSERENIASDETISRRILNDEFVLGVKRMEVKAEERFIMQERLIRTDEETARNALDEQAMKKQAMFIRLYEQGKSRIHAKLDP